jgi:predicted alpha-1,6-mannanase (GH76 family)
VAPRRRLQKRPRQRSGRDSGRPRRDLDFATTITDWIAATLVDPQTGLVRDGSA